MTGKEKGGQAAFSEAYASLNAAQKEAVDTIEGPVMVIAGPGTGKTQVLTLRIANILLKTDTAPESILALTFTESGARAMRERLRLYLGATAYKINIFTFHGLAERLIRDYPDAYSKIIGGRPASELEKTTLLEGILSSPEFKLLRPVGDKSYYLKPILSELSELKRENVSPDKLSELIKQQEKELASQPRVHEKGAHKGKVRSDYQKFEKVIAKNQELLIVYRQYEALMNESNLYDFDDMILETIKALEGESDMLADLQEGYQYVLADEHQDVNASQSRILELLTNYHDQPNLFVVGDEKQAIFRFQGASLENFLYFEDKFPSTKTITLTENYRSGQAILDAAHSLIKVEDGPLSALRAPLTAARVKNSNVSLREFTSMMTETEWVVGEVARLKAEGVSLADIAVILRTNKEVEFFAEKLRRSSLSATASASGDIQGHAITLSVLDLVEAAVEPPSEQALFRVVTSPYWGIPLDDSLRVLRAKSYDEPLLTLLTNPTRLQELGVSAPEKFKNMMSVLGRSLARSNTDAPHRLLAKLLTDSGFLAHVNNTDPIVCGRIVRRLYDEVENMVRAGEVATLRDVLQKLKTMREHKLPLNAPYIETEKEAVAVMTAHKAKGLEYSHVFIPNLVDSVWGGGRSRTLFKIPLAKKETESLLDKLDDEKRLLYVAMTRAESELYLSYSETSSDGRALTPSRLLAEVDATHLNSESVEAFEKSFSSVSTLEAKSVNTIDTLFFIEYLREKGFSATSLNNYLDSPWNWIFRNVLRLPEVQELPLLYGTAIHAVLEKVAREQSEKQTWPNASTLKLMLEKALGRLPLSENEFTSLHEKGLSALVVYLEHMKQHFPHTTRQEFSLRVVMPTGLEALPELPLTGNLDRLDFDESGRLLRVVDYKTGKPKSRNAIEGKTKDSNGGYKRQLIFYALLLELYDDERFKSREGVLSFVEPDSKGAVREEVFTITDEEIDNLRQEIISSAEEIISGKFLEKECDPSDSDYCDLANSLFKS